MNKIINWMGGWPKDGLVSASEWEERLAAAAERCRREGLASGPGPALQDALKDTLRQGLLKEKTQGKAGRLRFASGADTALTRLVQRSLSSGDTVLTESLTSRAALQAFRKAGIRVEPVEGDGKGMDPASLQAAIAQHRPRLVYAAPACSDPEGAMWEEKRLSAVAGVCREAGVMLLRDDRQEMMQYDDAGSGRGIRQEPVAQGVMSIGQLPPGLIAGLRFGWLAGVQEDLKIWYPARQYEEAPPEPGVTPLERQALADLLRDQPLEPLLDMLRVQCGERMRRLTEMLGARRIPGLRWRDPAGGVHLWLTLPEGIDGEALLRGAWIKGLMFQPGAPFYVLHPKPNTLRLTFAYADERQMKLGVTRLTDALGDFLGRFDIG